MNKIIIGNWKMNKTVPESTVLVEKLKKDLSGIKKTTVVVCPPFTSLYLAAKELKETDIKLGAQNCYFEEKGAFTGEVSPLMLKGMCQYVILGHSERRIHLGETDKDIAKKTIAVLRNDMIPIVCVGDTLPENQGGFAKRAVISQIEAVLSVLTADDMKKVIFAYEPIWAISPNKPCDPRKAKQMIGYIRKAIPDFYLESLKGVMVLYGGSVDSYDCQDYLNLPEISGLLVGAASLDHQEFSSIIKKAEGKR